MVKKRKERFTENESLFFFLNKKELKKRKETIIVMTSSEPRSELMKHYHFYQGIEAVLVSLVGLLVSFFVSQDVRELGFFLFLIVETFALKNYLTGISFDSTEICFSKFLRKPQVVEWSNIEKVVVRYKRWGVLSLKKEMVLGFFDKDSNFLGTSPFLTKRKGMALIVELMELTTLMPEQLDLSLLNETIKEELVLIMKQQKENG